MGQEGQEEVLALDPQVAVMAEDQADRADRAGMETITEEGEIGTKADMEMVHLGMATETATATTTTIVIMGNRLEGRLCRRGGMGWGIWVRVPDLDLAWAWAWVWVWVWVADLDLDQADQGWEGWADRRICTTGA